MPVEVACLVGLVGAVGAAVAPLPRVRQDVPPQQELLVGAVEHLATHATDAAASHTLLAAAQLLGSSMGGALSG